MFNLAALAFEGRSCGFCCRSSSQTFACGTLFFTGSLVFFLLKVSGTAATNDDGCGLGFGYGDLVAVGKGGHELQSSDEMLLEFLATSVVGGGYPKLQSLPCNGEGCIV